MSFETPNSEKKKLGAILTTTKQNILFAQTAALSVFACLSSFSFGCYALLVYNPPDHPQLTKNNSELKNEGEVEKGKNNRKVCIPRVPSSLFLLVYMKQTNK